MSRGSALPGMSLPLSRIVFRLFAQRLPLQGICGEPDDRLKEGKTKKLLLKNGAG